jgi:hypothetical protein
MKSHPHSKIACKKNSHPDSQNNKRLIDAHALLYHRLRQFHWQQSNLTDRLLADGHIILLAMKTSPV